MINKQAKLIDGQALLEWLKEREKNSYSDIYAASYLSVIVEIQSGRFDSPSESESTVAERAKASIADRYKNALRGWHNPVDRAAGSYYNGYLNGVREMLLILGITIPGINAPKGDRNE